MKAIFVFLSMMFAYSALGGDFKGECERFAIKSAIAVEMISLEGESAKIISGLTGYAIELKQSRLKTIFQINLSSGAEYQVELEKLRTITQGNQETLQACRIHKMKYLGMDVI